MNPAAWSVRNHVAVNLLSVVLLVAGITAAAAFIPRSVFPEVSTNYVSVVVVDPGNALAEDVEQLITRPIEEGLVNVAGLRSLTSSSQPNAAFLFLEIDPSYDDLDPVLNEVRQEVAKVRNKLPATVEEPVIEEFEVPIPLLTLGVSYDAAVPETVVRPLLRQIQRELRLVPGVSDVQVDGLDDREIWIEVDPDRAERLGLGLADVVRAVDAANRNWSGGRLRGPGGERVVRVLAESSVAEDFGEIPLRTLRGRTLLLRDVATIRDRSAEDRTRARLNLRPGVTFNLVKQKGADARRIADEALTVFRRSAAQLPQGATTSVLVDTTRSIDIRTDTVLANGIQALLIITLLLVVFLDWRLAILVAIGLPVVLAGTFVVLLVTGATFDVLSLFGMILALGMLVDDAIVISENIYRHYEAGESAIEAAVRGTGEVVPAVLGSVATTVAAFLPLLLGEGIIGKFLFIVPVVVIAALTFSLVQAFFVLPSHMASFVRHPTRLVDLQARLALRPPWRERLPLLVSLHYWELRTAVDRGLGWVVELYCHALTLALRRRYAVVGAFCVLAVGALALVGAGLIPFRLFDVDYSDRAFVKLDLPANTSLDQTEERVAAVERALVEGLPRSDFVNLFSQVGVRFNDSNDFLLRGSNLAMITVDIDELNPLARPPSQIQRDLETILARFPEFTRATAEVQQGGPPVGRPVNVLILGEDFEALRAVAAEVKRCLGAIEGVRGIADSFEEGSPELWARVDRERAARAGIAPLDAGLAVTAAYTGLEAARLRWGPDEVGVRVVMDRRFRGDPERFYALRVINREGRPVPLAAVAELGMSSGLARIERRDQARSITVSADIDTRVTTSAAVNATLAARADALLAGNPGVRLRFAGENEDTDRSLAAMQYASILALFLIYTILAVIFNRFSQPLIVMSVIPFGIVGVIAGLLFQGKSMGLMSVMGMIALAGIVVNNSVVFVDFINQFRAQHPPPAPEGAGRLHRWFPIYRAGRTRLRPIALTSLTTIAGLWSLAFLTTGQEEFLAPMAQALVWGLSFATVITLILVPCLHAILDDVQAWRWHLGKRSQS